MKTPLLVAIALITSPIAAAASCPSYSSLQQSQLGTDGFGIKIVEMQTGLKHQDNGRWLRETYQVTMALPWSSSHLERGKRKICELINAGTSFQDWFLANSDMPQAKKGLQDLKVAARNMRGFGAAGSMQRVIDIYQNGVADPRLQGGKTIPLRETSAYQHDVNFRQEVDSAYKTALNHYLMYRYESGGDPGQRRNDLDTQVLAALPEQERAQFVAKAQEDQLDRARREDQVDSEGAQDRIGTVANTDDLQAHADDRIQAAKPPDDPACSVHWGHANVLGGQACMQKIINLPPGHLTNREDPCERVGWKLSNAGCKTNISPGDI
jgi:hypothetical protein